MPTSTTSRAARRDRPIGRRTPSASIVRDAGQNFGQATARPELRKMSTGDLLAMLGRAWVLLPEEDLQHVLGRWVPLEGAVIADRERRLARGRR